MQRVLIRTEKDFPQFPVRDPWQADVMVAGDWSSVYWLKKL